MTRSAKYSNFNLKILKGSKSKQVEVLTQQLIVYFAKESILYLLLRVIWIYETGSLLKLYSASIACVRPWKEQ